MIEFEMHPCPSCYWGGITIHDQDRYLVWYMQKSQTNDHNALISAKVQNGTWNKCKTIIKDGNIKMYLNDNLIGEANKNINGRIYMNMGSNTNPSYLKEIKITELS